MKPFRIKSMIWLLPIMCASLLCSTFADVPSASIFPVADMGLQLTFDLDPATRSSVQRGEQCFPFFPNTQFQGGTVLIKEYAGAQQSASSKESTKKGDEGGTIPDLFITIRFHSTETSTSSCLQVGGDSYGALEEGHASVHGDCGTVIQADWQWERITEPEGMSLLHTLSAKDVVEIIKTGGSPRTEEWDICVGSSSGGAGTKTPRPVNGLITLFQQQVAPTSLQVERGQGGRESRSPPTYPSPVLRPLLDFSQQGRLAAVTQRPGDSRSHLAISLTDTAETPANATDIYVNTLVDEPANVSLCVSSINQSSDTVGHCTLRSAIAACEALLKMPSTAQCSVHLPALSLITMEPTLGEVHVEGDSLMNGTLAILGNSCHIAPNTSATSSIRFLSIDGNDMFSFYMSNVTLSHFGNSLLSGGAMIAQNILSSNSLILENVAFVANSGLHGGALYIDQCRHVTLTSCVFAENYVLYSGGGLFLNDDTSDVTLTTCDFLANTAGYDGGGMYIDQSNAGVNLTACTFLANRASTGMGGGAYLHTANNDMTLTSCVFSKNIGLSGSGGAIFINADNDNMTFLNCSFIDNAASFSGGALFINDRNEAMTFTSCIFRGNNVTLSDRSGGAIFIDTFNADMTVSSCLFEANTASLDGGGVLVNSNNFNMMLSDCTFVENTAQNLGGAMYVHGVNTGMTLTACLFSENTAQLYGGGMYVSNYNNNLTLTACNFTRNRVLSDGGALFLDNNNDGMTMTSCIFMENAGGSDGGAIYVSQDNLDLTLSSCTFSGNAAALNGGGMYLNFGNDNVNLASCTFLENRVGLSAGGLYVDGPSTNLALTSCVFIDNVAVISGGAISVHSNNNYITLTSCLFTENQVASGRGGAVYVFQKNDDILFSSCDFTRNEGRDEDSHGGALFVDSDNDRLTLTSCLFSENSAEYGSGGALFLDSGNDGMTLTSCIFTENVAQLNGGAVYLNTGNRNAIVTACNLTHNTADYGGGLFLSVANDDMVVTSCSFVMNNASSGAGVYVNNANQALIFNSCDFLDNVAVFFGGGMFVNTENNNMAVSLCHFKGNEVASGGGGVYLSSANDRVAFASCLFLENIGGIAGGGMYVNNANDIMSLVACVFDKNFAFSNGGGLYIHSVSYFINIYFCNFTSNTAQNYGGGLYINSDNDDLEINSCTFEENTAHLHGGGVYVGSNNWDLQLMHLTFAGNIAHVDGGALAAVFDNFRMRVSDSLFYNNSAGTAGGAIHSALQSNNLELSCVEFVNNSAGLYGGSLFLGENHDTVLISDVTVRGSFADSGGGLYLNRFSTDIRISTSDITRNSGNIGGGLVSFVSGLTIQRCTFDSNIAVTSHGGVLIEDAVDYLVFEESNVRRNVAGSYGGLGISKSENITVKDSLFEENKALVGGGGAFSLSESETVLVYNTSFIQNYAALIGGAIYVHSFNIYISFVDTTWYRNIVGRSGGAIYVTHSLSVEVNAGVFSQNVVQAGSGSAIYARYSNLSMLTNVFSGNTAFGGGTVFWEHASDMKEPIGLQSGGNDFDHSNAAGYGPQWATEAHHLRLLDDKMVYSIIDYSAFAPEVDVTLEDVYNQTVATDSNTFVTVDIPLAQVATCDEAPGFVSGTTTIAFVNGTASFTSLEPLCAPNHSLGLSASALLTSVTSETAFQFDFRACVQGEYYEERICNPCKEGTFSFTDPHDVALSELTKTTVCQPCPPEAMYCYKDTLALRQGYWRSDNDSTNILECPWDEESCLGGQSSGDASCGSGYHGPLCAICEDEHHFVSSSQTCEPCDDTSSFFDPFTITVIALVLVCMLISIYFVKKIIRKETVISVDDFIALCLLRLNIYTADEYVEEKSRLFQRIYLLRVRAHKSCIVYITFYQIVSTLPFILADVDFPDVYDRLISAVSVVNLAINQESIVSCSSSAHYDYVTKLVVTTTYPMVIVLLLWLCCQIHLCCALGVGDNTLMNQQQNKTIKEKVMLGYKKAVLVLTFLILPSVSVKIFQTFSCHDVGSQDEKEEYMTADYSVSCDSERYSFAFWWAVAMVFVYPLGIPLLYLSILYQSKNKIRMSSSRVAEKKIVHMLCEDYAVEYWYWEVMDTMYRVSVTGFLVLFQSTSDTIVAGMLLSLTYIKLIQLLQPFTDPELNRIKETSIWQLFFVFQIALLLKTNSGKSEVLSVCLLIVFFINFIILLGKYLVKYWLRHVCAGMLRGVKRQSGGDEIEVGKEMEMEERCTAVSTFLSDSLSPSATRQQSNDSVADVTKELSSSSREEDGVSGSNLDEHRQTGQEGQIHSPFHPEFSETK